MKFEITHDTLARKVFEKASTEDRARQKALSFVRTRYLFYLEHKTFLRTDDLNYILPYQPSLVLSPEEQLFIQKSQQRAQRRNLAIAFSIVLVIGILGYYNVQLHYSNKEYIRISNLAGQRADSIQRQRAILLQQDNEINISKEQLLAAHAELKLANSVIKRINDSLATANQRLQAEKQIIQGQHQREKIEKTSLERQLQEVSKEVLDLRKRAGVKKPPTTNVTPSTSSSRGELSVQLNPQEDLQAKRAEAAILAAQANRNIIGERKDVQLAFQLADRALELDPNNQTAIEVIEKIQGRRINTTDVFVRSAPRPKLSTQGLQNARTTLRSTHGTLSKQAEAQALRGN